MKSSGRDEEAMRAIMKYPGSKWGIRRVKEKRQ